MRAHEGPREYSIGVWAKNKSESKSPDWLTAFAAVLFSVKLRSAQNKQELIFFTNKIVRLHCLACDFKKIKWDALNMFKLI